MLYSHFSRVKAAAGITIQGELPQSQNPELAPQHRMLSVETKVQIEETCVRLDPFEVLCKLKRLNNMQMGAHGIYPTQPLG